MSIDAAELGQLVASFMETIEEQYGDEAHLGVFAIVAEVNINEDDSPGYTEILYRCNDPRRWIQQGLFRAADRAVLAGAP